MGVNTILAAYSNVEQFGYKYFSAVRIGRVL